MSTMLVRDWLNPEPLLHSQGRCEGSHLLDVPLLAALEHLQLVLFFLYHG